MNLFNHNSVPKWAYPMNQAAYNQFRQMLLESSDGRLDVRLASKAGILKVGQQTVGIVNLAQQLLRTPQDQWLSEIERWSRMAMYDPKIGNLSYPEDMASLRLQLYPSNFFDQKTDAAKTYLFREDIPGTITTVMVDTPDALYTLAADVDSDFRKHSDEVYKQLISRLKGAKPWPIEFFERGNDVVAVIEGTEITTAAQVLAFEDLYPQLVGKGGVLLGIPNRHIIVAQRLQEGSQYEISSLLPMIVERLYQATPYMISPNLYHYKDGKFSRIQIEKKPA